MSAGALVTEDGWRVEPMILDGRPAFRVTRHGLTWGGKAGACFTLADVQARMGADAYARLAAAGEGTGSEGAWRSA